MTDQPTHQIDQTATVDNMFVPVDPAAAGGTSPETPTSIEGPTTVSFSDPEFAQSRFTVRANHQDHQLTAAEVQRLVQKGMGADNVVTELGELRKRAELADNWETFQAAMTANPGTALAAYAAQHGYAVGTVSDDGFTPFDPHQQAAPVPGATPATTASPELAAIMEKMEAQQQVVNALLAERQTTQIAAQHGATQEEVAAATALMTERGLPSSSMDLALQLVRSQTNASQGAPAAAGGGIDLTPSVNEMTGVEAMNHMLALMKGGNATLPGQSALGGAPARTSQEQLMELDNAEFDKKVWGQWAKQSGIKSEFS